MLEEPNIVLNLSGVRKATDLLPKGSVYTLPPNKVIEVSIPAHGALGGPPSQYPIPCRYIYEQRPSMLSMSFEVRGSTACNYANPVRRDVINIGGDQNGHGADNVIIRLSLTMPVHGSSTGEHYSHIDRHLEAIGCRIRRGCR
ncbi:multicopper oxidase [Piloderma croceum F 1598]|uniref:Multicopper oxidase n=1 Tax=Piloderma croceum (strain F 1598) TaxID=765440 RepID=A0A0C3G4J2_PILCF|nr:multicopper oxidase [Piloderma croceum F 1598]